MRSGVEAVAAAVGLGAAMGRCDLVVTGEGSVDGQTLSGKAPRLVASLTSAHGLPLAIVAGRVDDDVAAALGATTWVALDDIGPDPMTHAVEYVEEAARRLAVT